MAEATREAGKLSVFISYSRDDLDFAGQLDDALGLHEFDIAMDRHGISGGEDWKRRLGNLIRDADTVVFVLSPSSARSDICRWEVEEAMRLGKRIIPVACRPLDGASPPSELAELNYIFFYAEPKLPGTGFGSGLVRLVSALNTDLDWLREHTRLLQRASEWDVGGRPSNRLLSGNDIAEAKAWAARRPKGAPEPTPLHLEFIRASDDEGVARSNAQRQQLEAMAAAQAEREKALRQAEEALRQAADAQHKRAGIRNIALVAVSIVAALAGWQWWRAEGQRKDAEIQRKQAVAHQRLAETAQVQAEEELEVVRILYDQFNESGLATQQNQTQATELYEQIRRAAERDNPRAMNLLGLLYDNGRGAPQDYAKAREWYEKAAAKGNASAMQNLGLLYANGRGVPRDYAKAQEWYEKAAEKGNAGAMHNLGLLYANGQGVRQDYAKAREWYEKAVAKGNAGAMVNLGLLYANGRGVSQDYAKAREWYEKAAEKGNATAIRNLGVLYSNGQGVPRDYAKAREWYEKAAEKGDAAAMNNLGALYNNGQGVPQDFVKAREWYEKAAEKGNAVASGNLGVLYSNGQGVPRDYAKAREWYEKAAEKGDAAAMNNLGALYDNGQGVPQDFVKAREWYEKAAEKGDASAMSNLGWLYDKGQGVAQDYVKAREWYEKAAARGDTVATRNLGFLYANGRGVAQDYAKAREWYEKAAAKGDTTAVRALGELAINQAVVAGRHDEALKVQERLAAEVEEAEKKSAGKPGNETAAALVGVAWRALFTRDYAKSLAASDRSLMLRPGEIVAETNRAHALMFLNRIDDARALYVAHKGKPIASQSDRTWNAVVAEDFAELRKAGLTHPMMAEIEAALGVAP